MSLRGKIILSLLLIVSIPFLLSVLLIPKVVSSSISLGLNKEVREYLEASLDIYKLFFKALKRSFEGEAEKIVRSKQFLESLRHRPKLRDYLRRESQKILYLERIEVLDSGGRVVLNIQSDAVNKGGKEREEVEIWKDLSFVSGYSKLRMVFEVPSSYIDGFKDIGGFIRTYKSMLKLQDFLEVRYILLYLGILGLGVFFILGFALLFSQRLTKKLLVLHNAAKRIEKGDLDIELYSRSRDELGGLFSAFNTMARELRESRSKIAYLGKISACQEMAKQLAHEIKNPLTPIQLAIQELEAKAEQGDPLFKERLKAAIGVIKEEIEALKLLTSEFSRFAKLPQPQKIETGLSKFIRECEDETRYMGLNIEVRYEYPQEDIIVELDRILIKQVLSNLIRNAAEAIQKANLGEKGKIEVRWVINKQDRKVLISVMDNGPGLRLLNKEDIFLPSFSTKGKGRGLGLPIVKKIILEHGGDILVSNREEGGACFTVILPY
jgi:nitrogen fixation/metabolism regulation signal transduction histidine kinase